MVALPILGTIEARRGRDTSRTLLDQAWEMSVVADEFQRLAPSAIALAEHSWITSTTGISVTEIRRVMETGMAKTGFEFSLGSIAFWLWKLGELSEAPAGIADPYRLVIEGKPAEAAAFWEEKGIPYERALALAHDNNTEKLEALEILETLGAAAVAAKLRKTLRDQGVAVPRGKGRQTRDHVAGLTARQAEVLQLLDEGLTNTEIADQLFLSPRTIEHHVSAVLTKLDAPTREQAVSRAHREGLLAP